MTVTLSEDRLPLNKLRFGSVDARYEVNTRNRDDIEHFRTSYLEPSGINIDEFIQGDRFFVHGVKGAGKTALLRFVQLNRQIDHCLTKFITFSTEISDAERERILELSSIHAYEQNNIDVDGSAVDVWMLFIFRQIAQLIEDNRQQFASSRNISLFCELMKRFYDGQDEKNLLSWLAATVKTGKYKLKTRYLEAKLQGKEGEAERDYNISAIVDQAMRLLKDLSWEGLKGIYLFFDELNLSFAARATHRRDAILIRDLIIAVDRLNSYFIEERKPVYILAAARSEVLHAFNTPTHEINKILSGRGRELRWYSKEVSSEWPIVYLLEKKIRASEALYKKKPTRDVFASYFHHDIFGYSPSEFLVEATWCNPRDLVYLFGEAAKHAQRHEPSFGHSVISRVIDAYSTSAWLEKAEELSVEYAPQEVQSIKKILLSFERHFKGAGFEREFENKARNDPIMMMMMKKFDSLKILEDLYRIGIIGQSTTENTAKGKSFTQHWAYRGDNSFNPNSWMIIHKALWPELRLGRMKADV